MIQHGAGTRATHASAARAGIPSDGRFRVHSAYIVKYYFYYLRTKFITFDYFYKKIITFNIYYNPYDGVHRNNHQRPESESTQNRSAILVPLALREVPRDTDTSNALSNIACFSPLFLP